MPPEQRPENASPADTPASARDASGGAASEPAGSNSAPSGEGPSAPADSTERRAEVGPSTPAHVDVATASAVNRSADTAGVDSPAAAPPVRVAAIPSAAEVGLTSETTEPASAPGGFAGRVAALADRHPVLIRSIGAIVAGLLLFASFPPRTLWFLAPVAVGLLTVVVRGNGRLRGGFGYGMLAGLGFFLPLLPWTGIYVGPVPWLALSTVCAVYVGLFGLLARLVSGLRWWPLWVAAAWTLTEWARSSFPFGGFPWGRIAFGQADGWYLPFAMLGGAPLIGFLVALTGTLAVAGVLRVWRGRGESDVPGASANVPHRPRWGVPRLTSWTRIIGAASIVAIIPLTGVILRTALPGPEDGNRPITVAAIQGSVPRLGLDFNAQRRAVLDNHVKRTEELAAAVAAGTAPQPDVVIWPENSSDIDPLRNADAAALITRAARDIKAPILVGAVLVNDDRTTTNSVIVWTADGGPAERHDKKIIQPFGEYLPMRSFFRLFSEYADRAGYFVPGTGDGVVHAEPASGGAPVAIGVATCYEVAFDRAFQQAMDAGAQLLTVPSNNATFGDSEMTFQQLAMSRVRAVEHGRAVVVSVTTGVSAIITADGTIQEQTEQFVPAALVAKLPLRDDTTPATRLGPTPEWILCILAAAAAVAAIRRRTNTLAEPTGR